MNIFVANLNFKIQTQFLQKVFEQYGEVSSAKVITDRETGRSKGYGFIEMPVEAEGLAAIRELDGKDLEGKTIVVKQARPREEMNRDFQKQRER
jgi:RNA recognition motif-containing protein